MWTLLALAAAQAAVWAFNRWVLPAINPAQQPAPAAINNQPRATWGVPVPIAYGRQRIQAPTILWQGPLTNSPNKDADGNILSFNYFQAFQMAVCIPGGDHAELLSIYYGTTLTLNGDPQNANLATTSPIALGYWYGGSLTQLPGALDASPTWPGVFGKYSYFHDTVFPTNGGDNTLLPYYKGIAWFAFFSAVDPNSTIGEQLGGWELGESPQPPPYSFEVRCDCSGLVDPSLGPIGDDANPANVIYDLLTNGFGRGGIPTSKIDTASFLALGQTLDTEQHGCSLTIWDSTKINDVVNQLLQQIGAVRYENPNTGKIGVKAIRADYTVGGLPVFSDSDGSIIAVDQFANGAWADTVNVVRVVYTDRSLEYKDGTASESDLANFEMQGAQRAVTYRLPWITNATVAAAVAARELNALSRPLRKARIMCSRAAYTLNPGDVFKWTWSEFGISNLVMRVVAIDYGSLVDGRIAVDCVEDVFAAGKSTVAVPIHPISPLNLATPLVERTPDEAPRWLAYQAQKVGRIVDYTVPHPWYLAVPNTNDTGMQPELSADGGATFGNDGGTVSFLGRATVHTAYAQSSGPVDTITGIVIDSFSGLPFTTVAASDITNKGANLARIGNEIIGFLSATNNMDGTYTLNHVYRGLLDTVAVNHAVGERVYFMSSESFLGLLVSVDTSQVGHGSLAVGSSPIVRMIPLASGVGLSPESDQPTDTLTIAGRVNAPYPVAALAATSSTLEEEGLALSWLQRTRLSTTITLPDAATETLEGGVTQTVLAQKVRDDFAGAITLDTPAPSNVSDSDLPLGAVGYGVINAKVKTTLSAQDNWQTAYVPVTAYTWRNLLRNPRFANGANDWTVAAGLIQSSNTSATALGGGGNYVEATGAGGTDPDFSQTVDVSGYQPGSLFAALDFYDHAATVAGHTDTLQVDLISLDGSGTTLQTQTYGPTASSTTQWNPHLLEISALNTSTAKLKVRVRMNEVTGGGGHGAPTNKATEFRLRLGQTTSQLVTNGDMESGLTSWTANGGTFATETTGQLYTGAQYIAAIASSSERYQEMNVPAGWQYSSCVVDCARLSTVNGATGQVIVEARAGAGGTVLFSAQTAVEAILPATVWQRRRIHIDNIGEATVIRIRLLGVTVSSGQSGFDDVSCRLHKHLDTDNAIRWSFDHPVAQPEPSDANQYDIAYVPAISSAAPDLFMYDGTSVASGLGPGADLRAGSSIIVQGKFSGVVPKSSDLTTAKTTCFESLISNTTDDLSATNPATAAFTSTGSFTVVVQFKGNYPNSISAASGLLGRMDTHGWSLGLTSGGVLQAKLVGLSGTKSVTANVDVTQGSCVFGMIAYDSVAQLLYVGDIDGVNSVSTASGLGEFAGAANTLFRLFRSQTSEAPFRGQIARVWGYSRCLTSVELAALFPHGSNPTSDGTLGQTLTKTVAIPVASDTDGILMSRFDPLQFPLEYRSQATAGGNTGWLLACQAPVTNLALDQNPNISSGNWSVDSAPTRAAIYQTGVEGLSNSVTITGTTSSWLRLSGTTLGAGNVTVVFFVRTAEASLTMRVELTDSTGANANHVDVGLGTSGLWQMVAQTITWSAATATGRLNIYPVATAGGTHTIQVSGPFFIGQTSGIIPEAIPTHVGDTSVSSYVTAAPALWEQQNHEGELGVTALCQNASPVSGTLVKVRNGSNNDDARQIGINGSSQAYLSHYDGAASVNTAALAETWVSGGIPLVVRERARWCRADLIEHPTSFSRIVNGGGATEGRLAIWTQSTTTITNVDIGAANGSDIATIGIRRVTLWTREPRFAIDTADTATVP